MILPNITKEQFDKLNQLDRIELRLRAKELEEYYQGSITYEVFRVFIFAFLFIFILISIYYNGGNIEIAQSLVLGLVEMSKFIMIAAIFALMIDIVVIFQYKKRVKKLVSEYFDVKTNVSIKKKEGNHGRRKESQSRRSR